MLVRLLRFKESLFCKELEGMFSSRDSKICVKGKKFVDFRVGPLKLAASGSLWVSFLAFWQT